jgi:hypothetical protein
MIMNESFFDLQSERKLVKVNRATQFRLIALWELALAVGILTFWIFFFSADLVRIEDQKSREIYQAFESAFPLADAFLFFTLFIGGIGLLRKKSYGHLFSLLAGACLIFLGLLDISFNAQQGIYRLGIREAMINVFINLLCLGSGIVLLSALWKNNIWKQK